MEPEENHGMAKHIHMPYVISWRQSLWLLEILLYLLCYCSYLPRLLIAYISCVTFQGCVKISNKINLLDEPFY